MWNDCLCVKMQTCQAVHILRNGNAFELKVRWYGLLLWTTQHRGYASLHSLYSDKATEKEEFDQSEVLRLNNFRVLFLSKPAVCLYCTPPAYNVRTRNIFP